MIAARWKTWWTRPCGGRDVMQLALPLIISTSSWTLMHFIDRMFLFGYSAVAFAGSMPAGMVHFSMICFPLGLAAYTNTFVAQYYGAGRPERIGSAIWQGLRIGLYTAPFILATIWLARPMFGLFKHSEAVMLTEAAFYQILTFGATPTIMAAALSSFFTGRGKTRVVMMVDCSASLMNIVLDYAWIFGKFGFPEMGFVGAAVATVVSQWFKLIFYAALVFQARNRQRFGLIAGRPLDGALMRRFWRFGSPSGIQLFVEVSAFTAFLLLVGRLNELALGATNMAFNINGVAFIPLLGLGIAVTTMVGQQQGAGQPGLAARATWTAVWISTAYVALMTVLYLTVPELLMAGHLAGRSDPSAREVVHLTVFLLRFVAAYCLFDALNMVFVSALKGAGDTRFIMVNTLVTSPLPILVAYVGIEWFGRGIYYCWSVLTIWIFAVGLIYCLRFIQGRWRSMRVIEPDLGLPGLEPAL